MTYFTSNFKEIEAVQFINAASEGLEETFSNYPTCLDNAFAEGIIDCIFPMNKPVYLRISTVEGTMDIIEGDWIIHGVKGELYPCKNRFRKR